jgi:enterochelin esterase-like enzyme/endonuclease/exonuclease/phosphatase family metal-dependent hydrolase
MPGLRRALCCLLLLFLGLSAHASEVLAQQFYSKILNRDYRYQVYFPDGYAQQKQSYPVLYLLHGAGGSEHDWVDFLGARQTLDSMISGGQIQPLVVVMPGDPQGWWVDGARDSSESALLQELMPHAESHFRIQATPQTRVLTGLSAGGYGALNLVLKYPQRFAAAALLSPAIYDPLPPAHSSAMTQPPFQTAGKFDAQRWQSLNYTAHIDAYKRSGVKVPLYISSGDHDTFGIALQSAMLYEKLRLHQPGAVALRIVDGDHEGALWRVTFPEALQFLDARLHPALAWETVRVMSYNIRCGSCERVDDVNHWSRRKFLVADVIAKSRADVIGLQEAELFQVQDLAALLRDFDWVGAGRDDGKEKGEMTAVLVRRSAFSISAQKTLWLSPTPDQVSKGWDAMLNRTLTVLQLKSRVSGKELNFLNTHFDHMGKMARDESAKLIAQTVQALGADQPVILTGDFNAHADFPGYKALTASLQDAATVSRTPSAGGGISFNGFGTDLQPGNKIDYVFVSARLAVQSHQLITDLYHGLYASDHFPIVAEVLWH